MVVAPTGETNGRHAQRHGSVDWRRPASLHGLQGSNPARGWNQVSVVPTRAKRNRRRLRRKRPLEPPCVRQPPMVERATPSEALASRCASPKTAARSLRKARSPERWEASRCRNRSEEPATTRDLQSLSSAPVQPETPKKKAQLRQRQSPGPEYCAQPRRHGPERAAERAMERPAGGATCEGRLSVGEETESTLLGSAVGRERESCL